MVDYIERAISFLLGALAVSLYTALSSFRSQKDKSLFFITEHRLEVDNIMDSVTTMYDRAQIIKVHNSGGELKVGVKMYVSVEFESSKIGDTHDDWQRFPVDRGMDYLLNALQKEGVIYEDIAALRDSFLSRRLLADNQKSLLAFHLRSTVNASYIALVSSSVGVDEAISPSVYSKLETKINKLRLLYEKADRRKILF